MTIKENINNIRKALPPDVKLLVVSKTRTIEEIKEAYECGIRDFAENKVQELTYKYDILNEDVRWHLIGKLQRNKVKYIVGKVNLVHSLSSIDLAKTIEKEYSKKNEICDALIQINIGREESKSGILEEDLENLISEVEKLKFLKVKGIMVIIPKGDEESNRLYFRKTYEIFNRLRIMKYKNIKMEILSMGMSNDYKVAIEEGSNLIRIGTGIFGERNYK